ncbi:hypothetical protein GOBAR_DD30232 [Gossypium barbadense]|nr:hypothetical protein GOBAR_DD30232 [Gossypium barbadense]
MLLHSKVNREQSLSPHRDTRKADTQQAYVRLRNFVVSDFKHIDLRMFEVLVVLSHFEKTKISKKTSLADLRSFGNYLFNNESGRLVEEVFNTARQKVFSWNDATTGVVLSSVSVLEGNVNVKWNQKHVVTASVYARCKSSRIDYKYKIDNWAREKTLSSQCKPRTAPRGCISTQLRKRANQWVSAFEESGISATIISSPDASATAKWHLRRSHNPHRMSSHSESTLTSTQPREHARPAPTGRRRGTERRNGSSQHEQRRHSSSSGLPLLTKSKNRK